MQRVADVCIASHVLVEGLDLDDLGAHRAQVGDAGLVARPEESRGVVVTVLHMNHYLCKVPLHWYLLVTHLRRRRRSLKLPSLELKQETAAAHVFFYCCYDELMKCFRLYYLL